MGYGIKMGPMFKETKGSMRYTVHFIGTSDSFGTMNDLKYYVGKEYTLPSNSFMRVGYKFNNWLADCQDGIRTIENQEVVKNLAKKNGFIVNMTATWNGINYTIGYSKNGGTGEMSDQPCVYGKYYNLSKNKYKLTGYTFKGWGKNQTYNVDYIDEAKIINLTYTTNEKVNLYAIWQPVIYTVFYNGNGYTSGGMETSTFTYNVSGSLRQNAFYRTGYTFTNWLYGGKTYGDRATVINLTAEATTIQLLAQWARNPLTYIEDDDNKKVSIQDSVVEIDCTDFRYLKFKVKGQVTDMNKPQSVNYVYISCGINGRTSKQVMIASWDEAQSYFGVQYNNGSFIKNNWEWYDVVLDISNVTGVQSFSAWVDSGPGWQNWWLDVKGLVAYN